MKALVPDTGGMHLEHTLQGGLPGTLRLPHFTDVITDGEIMLSAPKEKSEPAFPWKSDVYS